MPTKDPHHLTPEDLQGSVKRNRKERLVRNGLRTTALFSLLVSILIVLSLVFEAVTFLNGIKISWLWGDQWAPPFNEYDLKTPLVGSLIVTGIAMVVAVPIGLASAIYLSEYAKPITRKWLKPVLEILAGIPSVVLGFFALRWVTPNIVQQINPQAPGFTLAAAGIGVGILTIPLIASVSEDALSAVPNSLREASSGLGAKRVTTTIKITIPAAISGLVAALIIGISRAIGETMVVFLAAGGGGNQAQFTTSAFDSGTVVTAAMAATTAPSDRLSEGVALQSLYFLGLLLFIITLLLNLIADRFVRRVRIIY
ncbi:MAG: phosphate ABC transporter permease subunit PstC [Gammaproteobacteria bacterium]|nr:phosphate ABC transporter permease subunit PstC [Gammaproteobacteria bacterium]